VAGIANEDGVNLRITITINPAPEPHLGRRQPYSRERSSPELVLAALPNGLVPLDHLHADTPQAGDHLRVTRI